MSNTLFIGKVLHHFDELTSTNDYARDLTTKSKPAEGTVIWADNQSAGRGQFGSRWESGAGENLTLSVILYPTFLRAEHQFALSEMVALAVRDCIAVLAPNIPLCIKWPNDVYLSDRKVAGMLIQNALSGERIQSSVIGIGLNVNQMKFSSVAANPVSLAQATGAFFDLQEVADTLFKHLEVRYLQLKKGHRMTEEYQQSLYRKGQVCTFSLPNGTQFSGEIVGTTDAGLLRLQTENGIQVFAVKEVALVI